MIKRLIFDVDGTLIDTNYLHIAIENTLKRLGIYSKENKEKFLKTMFTYEINHNHYHKKEYIEHFKNGLQVELNDSFLNIYFEELCASIPEKSYEKLKSTLTKLSKHYELVLLTNYFKTPQLRRLHVMGIDDLFSECFGEELIKPNDEIYLKACGKYKPSECVMVGDNPHLDIEKAQSLGLHTIFVNTKGITVHNIKATFVNQVEDIKIDLIETLGDE